MRFSIDGWVENKMSMLWPVNGLKMNMCAVAGLRTASTLGHTLGTVVNALERGCKPHRLTRDLAAGGIGIVVARTADRHLHEAGDQAGSARVCIKERVALPGPARAAPAPRTAQRSAARSAATRVEGRSDARISIAWTC